MPLDKDRDNGHSNNQATAAAVKPPTAPLAQARRKFETALTYYQARDYRKAIVLFERVRQMAGLPSKVYLACLFNIGQANLKLRRFATAILYFETYLQSQEISDKDRKWAQGLLEDAKRGAGVSG